MKNHLKRVFGLPFLFLVLFICAANFRQPASAQETGGYDQLLLLFEEWRRFESPPLLNGAPDYATERFRQRYPEFQELRKRLSAFEVDQWPVFQRVIN